MKAARALDHAKLALDGVDALGDGAPVGLDLRFARAAQEAEAAALPLQMGPGAHQPAFLIGQPRKFHLQPPGLALRALAKDFENEPGSVENLGVPGFLQIALLDGRQRVVDDDNLRLLRTDDGADFLDLARSEQRCGAQLRQRHRTGEADFEADSLCKALRFRQALGRRQKVSHRRLRLRHLPDGNGHDSARGPGRKPKRRKVRLLGAAVRLALLCVKLLQRC